LSDRRFCFFAKSEIPSKDDGFVIPYSDSPLNDKNPAEGIYMQILNSAQRYVYIIDRAAFRTAR
jgi:hypothetical protein